MKQIFSYNKFNEDTADTLVESCYALAQSVLEGTDNTVEYEEANKNFNESFMKYCVESIPNAQFSSLDAVKNPQIHKNVFFTTAFDTILAAIISPVAPQVASQGLEALAEVHQVGFGVA